MQIPAFSWRTRAWLPRLVTTNDILPNIFHAKPYTMLTMVIFPVAFIFHAYEEDSALNHMLTWYKVISVIEHSECTSNVQYCQILANWPKFGILSHTFSVWIKIIRETQPPPPPLPEPPFHYTLKSILTYLSILSLETTCIFETKGELIGTVNLIYARVAITRL